MPTGGEYRAMARELSGHVASLLQLVGPLVDAWGDDVVTVSTRLGLTITRTVEAADANASTAASTMTAMADECLARAIVCDQFAAAMGRYRAELVAYDNLVQAAAADPSAPPPSRPTRPTAPPWAEL